MDQTLSPLLIIVRVWLNLTHGKPGTHLSPSKSTSTIPNAPLDNRQHMLTSRKSATTVRVLVSHMETVGFPMETEKDEYEMHDLASYEKHKEARAEESAV